MAKDKETVEFDKSSRRTVYKTYTLYEKDIEIVNRLGEYLGCSNSEVIRRAVSAYASHLAYLDKKTQPGRPGGS